MKYLSEILKDKQVMSPKLFDETKQIDPDDKLLLIDAINQSPIFTGSNKIFIPLLVEDKEDLMWFMKNLYYKSPRRVNKLNREMPKEYNMAFVTAPMTVIYLEAQDNLPILNRLNDEGRPADDFDIATRNASIGMNMAFVSSVAYTLGYDTAFSGYPSGLKLVLEQRKTKAQLFSIYFKYNILNWVRHHNMVPCYALNIGHSIPPDDNLEGTVWEDGYYNNACRDPFKDVENLRIATNE